MITCMNSLMHISVRSEAVCDGHMVKGADSPYSELFSLPVRVGLQLCESFKIKADWTVDVIVRD